MVAHRATIPPVMCTTADPAKSIIPTPNSGLTLPELRNPLRDQIECATTGYTNPVKRTE